MFFLKRKQIYCLARPIQLGYLYGMSRKKKTSQKRNLEQPLENSYSENGITVSGEEDSERLAEPIGYFRKHGGLPAVKKSLGQNWLVDSSAAEEIVRSLSLSPGDRVIEVGPGGGALTSILLDTGAKVSAIEIDQRMVEVLKSKFESNDNIDIIHSNILTAEFLDITDGENFSLVGNLPYHITSSLLFKIMDHARINPGTLRRIVVMMQVEVAERIASPPGHSDYGILSVFTRLWGDPELVLKVDRSSFNPAPKVDAGVIRLDLAAYPRYPLPHWQTFKRLVKGTFHMRRKMLRNSLPTISQISDWKMIEFDWTRRPQTLSTEEFAWLAERLIPLKDRDSDGSKDR